MKLLTLAAACAALATLSAAPAFADQPVVAKLAAPIAQPVKFIAGGSVFNCQGDTCIARSPTSQTLASDSCRTIASKVGALTSFAGDKAMDEHRLAACNSVAVARAGAPQVANK
jgi:hypothetical protein